MLEESAILGVLRIESDALTYQVIELMRADWDLMTDGCALLSNWCDLCSVFIVAAYVFGETKGESHAVPDLYERHKIAKRFGVRLRPLLPSKGSLFGVVWLARGGATNDTAITPRITCINNRQNVNSIWDKSCTGREPGRRKNI